MNSTTSKTKCAQWQVLRKLATKMRPLEWIVLLRASLSAAMLNSPRLYKQSNPQLMMNCRIKRKSSTKLFPPLTTKVSKPKKNHKSKRRWRLLHLFIWWTGQSMRPCWRQGKTMMASKFSTWGSLNNFQLSTRRQFSLMKLCQTYSR